MLYTFKGASSEYIAIGSGFDPTVTNVTISNTNVGYVVYDFHTGEPLGCLEAMVFSPGADGNVYINNEKTLNNLAQYY